jgi:hypothetical protein
MKVMVVNGQWRGECIDHSPKQGGGQLPPFKGALTACHPHQKNIRRTDAMMNKPTRTSPSAASIEKPNSKPNPI